MPETVLAPLGHTLQSGFVAEGPRVKEFEAGLAPWFGTQNVLALNSGTSALHLAVRLAQVGYGDEVISTPMTCLATNHPILLCQGRIVWADVNPNTGNICPRDIRRKITRKTKAIMVMHWGGCPCEMDSINELAAEYGLKVIEDACQAFGATYRNQPIGRHSDFVCFSFQAVKVMTTGDGGALTCKSRDAWEKGKLLRWFGVSREMGRVNAVHQQDVPEPGYKFQMNDIAATIGIEQLRYVKDNIERAQANAAAYDEAFGELRSVTPLRVSVPGKSACWVYTLRVKERERFQQLLRKAGVMASPLFCRNDTYSAFAESVTSLPGVDVFDAEHVCIPVGWWLGPEEVQRVIDAVLQADMELSPARVCFAQASNDNSQSDPS